LLSKGDLHISSDITPSRVGQWPVVISSIPQLPAHEIRKHDPADLVEARRIVRSLACAFKVAAKCKEGAVCSELLDQAGLAVTSRPSAFVAGYFNALVWEVAQPWRSGVGQGDLACHNMFQIMPAVEARVPRISRVISKISQRMTLLLRSSFYR
jgi:hypothetical protein